MLLAVPSLSEKQIDFFLIFPFIIVEVLSNGSLPLLNHSRETFQVLGPLCPGHAITTCWHKTQVNDNSLVSPSPLWYFQCALQESRLCCQVGRWDALLSILHAAQWTTIRSAIHTLLSQPWLRYLTDFLYLFPLFYFCTKPGRRHLFLWVINFLQTSSKAHARANKGDEIWNQETALFLATAPVNCKEKSKGRKRISYCSTTTCQSGSLQ